MARLFPSLMAADLLNLASIITALDPYCDGFHIDIMDDHFVPNITFGADMTNAIAKQAQKPCWVHLMINKPADFIEKLTLKQSSIITFHQEGCSNPEAIITLIRGRQCKAGIALKPATPVSAIAHILSLIDQVLIMSVEPGFSGQGYMASVETKIKELVNLKKNKNLSFSIAIDGGINTHNILMLKERGVDDFAIASALFGKADYKAECIALNNIIKSS